LSFAKIRYLSFSDAASPSPLLFDDATVSPEAWPEALKALTDAAGVEGAALIVSNRNTGKIDEVCFSGLSAEFKLDYVRHYATLDSYSPLLDGSWIKVSDANKQRSIPGRIGTRIAIPGNRAAH
jgi:hypothetical protein